MSEEMPGAPWWVIASWLITIVGWVVVERRSNKHASTSESFQMVREAEDHLNRFRSNVIDALVLTGKNDQADRLRRAAIHDTGKIQLALRLLCQRDPRFNVKIEYLKLKRMATGKDFESPDRDALPMDDQRISEIDQATDNLIANIHRVYNETYRRFRAGPCWLSTAVPFSGRATGRQYGKRLRLAWKAVRWSETGALQLRMFSLAPAPGGGDNSES